MYLGLCVCERMWLYSYSKNNFVQRRIRALIFYGRSRVGGGRGLKGLKVTGIAQEALLKSNYHTFHDITRVEIEKTWNMKINEIIYVIITALTSR